MKSKKDQIIMDQYRCPTGIEGKKVAASMNIHHSDLTDWGLNTVEIDPDFTILDVGCGGGKTITKLANIAFKGKVYGIDYSKDMVEYSREVNRDLIARHRVSILEGSIDKSGFPDNYFDLVTAIETYYFWPNLHNDLKEIYRVLKLNGRIVLINEGYICKNKKTVSYTHLTLPTTPYV